MVRGPVPSIYAGAGSVHSMTLEPVVATAAMSTSSSLHFPPGARAHMLPPQLWSGGGVVELWASLTIGDAHSFGDGCASVAGKAGRALGLSKPMEVVNPSPLILLIPAPAGSKVCIFSAWRGDTSGSYYAFLVQDFAVGLHLADYEHLRRRRRRLGAVAASLKNMTLFNDATSNVGRALACASVNIAGSLAVAGAMANGLSTELFSLARVFIAAAWLSAVALSLGVSFTSTLSFVGGSALRRLWTFNQGLAQFMRAVFWLTLASRIVASEAVCLSCNWNDPACPGDNTCIMAVALAANVVVMAGGAAAANKVLDMGGQGKPILPLTWLQVLKPAVLDALVALARRAPLGTPLAIREMTLSNLLDSIIAGTTSQVDARLELARRITVSSMSEDERTQIKMVCDVLPKASDEARGAQSSQKMAGAGALQYVYAIAMRIVRHLADPSKVSVTGASVDSQGGSSAATLAAIDLKRPKSMAEFTHSLTVWQALLSAVGLASAVVLGPFLSDVVHTPMIEHSWEVALEHFLLYVQKIDSGCGWQLANATMKGSQDTFLNRAIKAAPVNKPPGKPVEPLARPSPGGGDAPKMAIKWNGKSNSDPAARPCAAHNTGTEHNGGRLKPDGTCPFRHVCDHWVNNKGPAGKCLSAAHGRSACTNAAKSERLE